MNAAIRSITDEVEAAIGFATPQRARETVRQVTDLLLASADQVQQDQAALFDSVLERLIKTLELRALADVSFRIALAEMSLQLAPMPTAPRTAVRLLAANDDITVAGPVLSESARLTDDDLIGLAGTKSEQHLLAISGRWWLKEIVTDALLARRYPSVSRRIVRNPGARISAAGFAIIISQAPSDPELAVETGIRADLPARLRERLLREATETVRSRLLSRAPPHLFEEIRRAVMAASNEISREMSKARDFAAAIQVIKALKSNGGLDEHALLGFATRRQYEETVAALAELSGSSVDIIRPLMQSAREDGILVACRVAALHWETAARVLECRYVSGAMSSDEMARAKQQFFRLDRKEALRLLNLWKVRAGASK